MTPAMGGPEMNIIEEITAAIARLPAEQVDLVRD